MHLWGAENSNSPKIECWDLRPLPRGRSGGAMVLGKLPVPGRPTIWITVGQGPTALAVGAGGVCLDIFTLIYPFSPLSPSLWDTARYRLKYCLKGPLNPKQPTNQPPPPPHKSILIERGYHGYQNSAVSWHLPSRNVAYSIYAFINTRGKTRSEFSPFFKLNYCKFRF